MKNLTPAQKRLLNKIIIANGLFDVITHSSLNTREKKTFYKLRSKGLYVYCIGDDKKIMLNVGKMINDSEFMNYCSHFKNEIMSIKMDRLKKARKEQAIANMLMRQTGLSATNRYKGLSIFNSIYSFYNDKESRLRSDLRKAQVRAERNELIELSYALDHTKTYAYSLDNYDYPFESKFN